MKIPSSDVFYIIIQLGCFVAYTLVAHVAFNDAYVTAAVAAASGMIAVSRVGERFGWLD